MKKIVTLITDFGTSDGYMGAVYGVLKSINPEIDIIIITCAVPPADIRKASRALINSCSFYPDETIHMVVVDPTVGPKRRSIIVRDERYYYIGPDNGVFTPVFKSSSDYECFQINNPKYRLTTGSETFYGRDLFAPAAGYITLGVPLDDFGPKINDPVIINEPLPEKIKNDIIGKVIDIDFFGNLVTNIPADMVKQDSKFIVCGCKITGLSKSYADVEAKQPLAYIGSTDYVEIAINGGHAANYFGALIYEEVKVVDYNN
ncbi:MAG: SAM-dependent chlorinase/fluorinase [candidate division Zixibacteria bacterium]|nr:SAM-dependent chlorinase/fluorinase [candidate division Zixibacteria bacterium]